jgi:hypothetical protein
MPVGHGEPLGLAGLVVEEDLADTPDLVTVGRLEVSAHEVTCLVVANHVESNRLGISVRQSGFPRT